MKALGVLTFKAIVKGKDYWRLCNCNESRFAYSQRAAGDQSYRYQVIIEVVQGNYTGKFEGDVTGDSIEGTFLWSNGAGGCWEAIK